MLPQGAGLSAGIAPAGPNLAQALAASGQELAAIEAARRTLEMLQRQPARKLNLIEGLPWEGASTCSTSNGSVPPGTTPAGPPMRAAPSTRSCVGGCTRCWPNGRRVNPCL